MEMQQMIECLLAGQEQMMAEMRAWREEMATEMKVMQGKRMEVNMNVYRKETMACQETTEACVEYEEPTSVEMESESEHWEVPKEEAAVKQVG
jgi:hypothetical protein